MSLLDDLQQMHASREGRAIINRTIKELEKLWALEAGGVDNWEWYHDSLKPWFKKYYPEDCDV